MVEAEQLPQHEFKPCGACVTKQRAAEACVSCAHNRKLAQDLNELKKYAQHLYNCSRGLPSALRPCNCGLLDLIGPLSEREVEKRATHPEYGPWRPR